MPTGPGRNAFRFPYDLYNDPYAINANFRYLQDYMLRGSINDAFAATALLSAPDSSNPQRAEYRAQQENADTTFQAALDDLPVAGGTLHFLEGTYNLDGPIVFPDKPVVLKASGKATFNIGESTTFGWDGNEQLVFDGFQWTGGAAGMNLLSPHGDFWFINNVVDDFTARTFISNGALGQFSRVFVTDNIFRDISIETTGTDFNQLGIVIIESGGSRSCMAWTTNNFFNNITHTTHTGAAYVLTYGGNTTSPHNVQDNIVENCSTLNDYFKGAVDLVSHNTIDGTHFPGSHNLGVDDLNDAVITGTPADNEVLAYDSTSGDWINQTAAEAALAAASHQHVEADVTDLDHYDDTDANAAIDARVTEAFVEALNIEIVEAQITDLDHDDVDAIHDNVASEISAITAKATPTSSDFLLIEDAADSNNKKRITIGTLPGAASDHGALTGLADDDHTQYHNDTRHDAHDHTTALGTANVADLADVTEWADWTPTYLNITLGNGAVEARWIRFGDLVVAEFQLEFGTTTSLSGTPVVSLPVNPAAKYDSTYGFTNVGLLDANGSDYIGRGSMFLGVPQGIQMQVLNAASTYLTYSNITSTVPFTWTTGDFITFQVTYEAA